MRLGKTEEINKTFESSTITFGCAANWLDYAFKYNIKTGDFFEGVFAQVSEKEQKSAEKELVDKEGNPMGDNLIIIKDPIHKTSLLSYQPIILMPVFCLYSFSEAINKELFNVTESDPDSGMWKFDLDDYRSFMEYKEEESSFLFITDSERFFNDLKKAIPSAIEINRTNLTTERFYGDFNTEEALFADFVDYDKHNADELFFDTPGQMKNLFWKLPKYEKQAELRLVIPNINYVQMFNREHYDFSKNTLDVYVPDLQQYTQVITAKEAHFLRFTIRKQPLKEHYAT